MRRVNVCVLFFIFCFSQVSQAEVFTYLSQGYRFETSTSGYEVDRHSPFSIGGGYHFDERWSSLLEYTKYDYQTTTGDFSVQVEHMELGAWGRFKPLRGAWWPYVGAGIGLQRDSIQTRFWGQVEQGTSEWIGYFGLSTGVWWPIWKALRFGGELRFFYKPRASTTTNWDALLSLGADF